MPKTWTNGVRGKEVKSSRTMTPPAVPSRRRRRGSGEANPAIGLKHNQRRRKRKHGPTPAADIIRQRRKQNGEADPTTGLKRTQRLHKGKDGLTHTVNGAGMQANGITGKDNGANKAAATKVMLNETCNR